MAAGGASFCGAAWPLAALGLVAISGSAACAQDPVPLGSAQLHYTRGRGADACPDEASLSSEVIARLGYDPFDRSAPRTLDVSVLSEGGQLRATIVLSAPDAPGPSTHRLVSSALDCSVLHPALGLAIALAIDPARALALDATPGLPPPAPPRAFPKPLQESLRDPAAQGSDGERPRSTRDSAPVQNEAVKRRGTLHMGAYAAVAASPSTTGGVELGGAAVYSHFSIGAELRGDMPRRTSAVGGSIELGRVFVEGVPCFRTIAFGFGICALAAVGLTIARGYGFVVARDVFTPYFALGARLMAEIPLSSRFALGLHADVLGLVTRLSLKIDAATTYTDAPASGAFGVDLVVRFGDGK